ELGVPAERFSIVPYGVDDRFRPAPRPAALLRAHGLEGKTVVLFLGGLKPRKNLFLLLDVWRRVAQERDDARLVIAGSGPLLERLREHAGALARERRVVFTGYVPEDEKVGYYNMADVLLFPSVLVGFALRLDDVGAASKQHEVYGLTRIRLGSRALPFPGNFLFLKYLPPIKRWGPYRELSAREWEGMLVALEAAGARMTAAITAGWVGADGGVTPFPRKFPDAAGVIREGVRRGLVEVANHGYTHCVLRDRPFRPRLFGGN